MIRQCFSVGFIIPPIVPPSSFHAPDDSRGLSVLGNSIPNYQIQHLFHLARALNLVF